MKISVAQIKPSRGDIQANIDIHTRWIAVAKAQHVDFLAFSELSLTGYEPEHAKALATPPHDPRLDVFQSLSDENNISIGLGLPTPSPTGVRISMVLFQPHRLRQVYAKQQLHSDELPYFEAGNEQLICSVGDQLIAPAICYESLQKDHAAHARQLGADMYLASVAKPQRGIDKAFVHYPEVAKAFSMPVLMSNSIGYCDNFLSAGQSAVWNEKGELLASLAPDREGLLIFDTATSRVVKVYSSPWHTFTKDQDMAGSIHPYTNQDREQVLNVWEASVLATHDFLLPTDFEEIKALVHTIDFHEFEVYCLHHAGVIAGFIGIAERKIEMLFLSPAYIGKGFGRQLIHFAIAELKADSVDVNEQNTQAVAFYKKLGFKTYERTDHDDQGKAYPLLRMKLEPNN